MGNRIKVETDYGGSDVDHSLVHGDRELIGAMKSFGINKVEGSKSSGALYSLHENFDKQLKKKYGREQGYLRPF